RLPPFLFACEGNAPGRRISQLGLRRALAGGLPESCIRRAQPRRAAGIDHHGKLRLYPALPSIAECSEASHGSRKRPRFGCKRVRHYRSPRNHASTPRRSSLVRVAAHPIQKEGGRSPQMILFDENPSEPPDPAAPGPRRETPREESLDELSSRIVVHPLESAPPGEPIAVEFTETAPAPNAFLPEDLRISWSWLHLLFFGLFAFG